MRKRFRKILLSIFLGGVLIQGANAEVSIEDVSAEVTALSGSVSAVASDETTYPDTIVCGKQIDGDNGRTVKLNANKLTTTSSKTGKIDIGGITYNYQLYYDQGNYTNCLSKIADADVSPSGGKLTVATYKNFTYTWYKKSFAEEDFSVIEGETENKYTASGYGNQDKYRVIRTSPNGYCSDTIEWNVVYAPEVEMTPDGTLDSKGNPRYQMDSLSFEASENCKAKFRAFDHIPMFAPTDKSYVYSDTVASYWKNGDIDSKGILLSANDSIEVEDGDRILMSVGYRYYNACEGEEGMVAAKIANLWRTVTVTDTTRPKVIAPLSDGNIYQSVVDSASGVVPFTVTEAEIRNSVSDNCTPTENLQLAYSLDNGGSYSDFSGFSSNLNVYTQPTLTVSYKITDASGNVQTADVTYEVERNTLYEGVQYAVVRDTTVESTKVPFTWHGVTFEEEGESHEVGAAHLTLHVAKPKEIDTTMVICAASYTIDGRTYQKGKTQFKYTTKNSDGDDITYNVDLYVVGEIEGFTKDTVKSEVCANSEVVHIGFDDVAEKTTIKWFDDEVENSGANGVKMRDIHPDGLKDKVYKGIFTTAEGYCPDTAIFALNVGHDFVIDQTSTIVVKADENCTSNVLVKAYAPKVKDQCGIAAFDTIIYMSVNGGDAILVENDTRYNFADGDQIAWMVGTEKVTVSTTQTVTVSDATAPVIADEGISFGNTTKAVSDSATGVVQFNVPLTEVTEYISDNCTSTSDLTIEYSLDGSSFSTFNGEDLTLNVYTQPTLNVTYKVTDKASNPATSSVTYEVERNTLHDGVQYAVVRDTTVKASKVPFVWHGATFNNDGESQVVGAAHLTLHVVSPAIVDTSMVICDATYTVNGQSYEKGRHSVSYTIEHENGVDTTFNVSLFVVGVIEDFSKDTVVSTSCGPSLEYIGYENIAEKTTVRWFDNGVENLDVQNNKRRDIHTDGIADNFYKVIYSTAEGYCADTAYYLLEAEHDFELDKTKTMKFYANEDCKARVLLKKYAPTVSDLCVTAEFDTVAYISINGGEQFQVTNDTYYDFVDGDQVFWAVGMESAKAGYRQTVSVKDTISPKISVENISLGKREITATDTITGAVEFDVALEEVTENISDNCSSVADLTVEYGLDGKTFTPFAGDDFALNAYTKSDLTVYFRVTDQSGNKKVASVTYTVAREADGYAFSRDTFVCNGDLPLSWYGYNFTTSGESAEVGAVRLTVHERELYERTQTEVACDQFEWINGETYTESTKAVFVKENGFGLCDSTIRLDLTILKKTYGEEVISVCENALPAEWGEYKLTKDTTVVLQNAAGCDSILTLKLNILKTTYGEDVQSVCEKDLPLAWNGFNVTSDTTVVLQNVAGCDSILTLKLNVLKTTYGEDAQSVCEKDLPLAWNGFNVTSDTTVVLQNVAGCDSILTLKLNVLKSTYGTDVQTVCESSLPYEWHGFMMETDTTIVLENVAGCDSFLTLRLNVIMTTVTNDERTICENELPLAWNGYEVSKDTSIVMSSVDGCDSIVNLKLNVNPTFSTEFAATGEGVYIWNNKVYSRTGAYRDTFTSVNGCDSVVTMNLQITYKTVPITERVISCGSFLWNDTLLEESGLYFDTIPTLKGDSVISIMLTVNKPTYAKDTIVRNHCQDELPVFWNSNPLEPGLNTFHLENHLGCDSIVYVRLTVWPLYNDTFTIHACDAYVMNGRTLTTSGIYTDTLTSLTGCDSIVTVNLTVDRSFEMDATDTVYVGDTYTDYGLNLTFSKDEILEKDIYLETATGCDSLIHLTLVVKLKKFEIELANVSGGFELMSGNQIFCEEHNVEVNYHIASGEADSFKVMFDMDAVSQGFREIEGPVSDTVGTITFDVPENVFPGKYKAYIQFYDNGYASEQVEANFYVGYGSDMFVVNSKNEISLKDNIYGFSEFQWYKNGSAIEGATSSTYLEPQSLDGVYVLGVKTLDGDETVICGKQAQGAANFNVWIANNTSSASRAGVATLYVEGLTSEELQRTHFYVYTTAGVKMMELNGITKQNELNLKTGVYVGVIKLDDTLKYIKFIAE